MSVRNLTLGLSVIALLGACATQQESPIYQQSTKYKVHAPDNQPVAQPANYGTQTEITQDYRAYNHASQTAQTVPTSNVRYGEIAQTRPNQDCLSKESDRKLIGTGVGAAAGGLAGNKIAGGTKATVIGAVVGGAAGYGIADKTIHCDPLPVQTSGTVIPTNQPTDYSSYNAAPQAQTTVTNLPPAAPNTTSSAPTDSAYGETFGTPGYHAMQANGELDDTKTASVAPTVPIPAPATAPVAVAAPVAAYPQPEVQAYIPPAAAVRAQDTEPFKGNTAHRIVEGDTVYSLSRKLCVGVEDIKSLNGLDGNFSIRLDDYIRLPASRC